jgi:large subunit ribosomal protein L23
MALFSKKENKKADKEVATKEVVAKDESGAVSTPVDFSRILRNARITEKAARLAGNNTYVFDVAADATKTQIKSAIETIYKVKPTQIRTVTTPKKPVKSKKIRKTYYKGGGKKAYVTLRKGDSIQLA